MKDRQLDLNLWRLCKPLIVVLMLWLPVKPDLMSHVMARRIAQPFPEIELRAN